MTRPIGATLFAAAMIMAAPACGQDRDPLAPLDTTEQAGSAATSLQAPTDTSFSAYMAYVAQKARSQGVSQRTIDAVIPGLTPNSRVIELDQSQPGGGPGTGIPDYAPYRRRHVTNDIVNRGKAKYREHYPVLARIQQQTGVDPFMILAIYGKETSYGRITGNFDLPQSLATLAWEGRRRDLFESEFIAALKLMDKGYTRDHLKGSWAGAAGKPQFMPSNILTLAADGDGDGFADIWNSEPDAFMSIANYLKQAGWQPGIHWGAAVRVPASLDREAVKSTLVPPRCERVFARHSRFLTVAEWKSLGVTFERGSLPDDVLATLIEPDGRGETAYLTTQNYRPILDYNCSNFYALTNGLVADAIER